MSWSEVDGMEEVEGLIPTPRRLFKTIERTLEFKTMTRGYIDVDTVWDFNEDFFIRYAIEESTPDVHLLHFPVMSGRDAGDYSKGGQSPSGREGVPVVYAFNLTETLYT